MCHSWTGALLAPHSAFYFFKVIADDMARLLLNGDLLIGIYCHIGSTDVDRLIMIMFEIYFYFCYFEYCYLHYFRFKN